MTIFNKRMQRIFILIISGIIVQYSIVFADTATVNIIQAPIGSFVPDVVIDKTGLLHMVYAQNNNAYYVNSRDNGATFSTAVKINSSGKVEFKMGERGPKLAVGNDGVIHVVWGDLWSPTDKVYTRYTRSINGGKTFENLKTLSSVDGVDGITVAADGKGNVFCFWHMMLPVQSTIPQATFIHFARSINNGVSFTADTNIRLKSHSGLACSMCMMRARFGTDGKVYVIFRIPENNIRDFYVFKGLPADTSFDMIRVNNDNWNINTCPMVGPEMTVAPDSRFIAAFMSGNKVYWAISDSGVTKFRLHVSTPLNETNEIYPSAIANQRGQVLFLWQVGPMSTSGTSTVKWALYGLDGTYFGKKNTIGTTTSGTKATSFTGSDDNFYIIINSSDTNRPTIPLITACDSLSTNTVKLHWNGSTDNILVADYEVFKNDSFFLRTKNLNVNISIISNLNYTFKVRAKDNTGNYSGFSNIINVKLTTPVIINVSSVSLDKKNLNLIKGQSVQLHETILPLNATNKSVSWKSSDTAIASVDNNGLVLAKKTGKTVIIVITNDGNKVDSCHLDISLSSISEMNYISALYPNPAKDQLTICLYVQNAGLIKINITDLSGKIFTTEKIMLKQGENQILINTAGLKAGNYILTTNSQKFKVSVKFAKAD